MSESTGLERRAEERRQDSVSRHELTNLYAWVKDIDDEMKSHTKAEARMEERITQIETDIKEVRDDVKTILDVVSRAKGVWGFMGWVVGVVVALAGMWAWGKEHLK